MSPLVAAGRRAVVIGSGLSGLTTATLLAEAGWQVTILEQHRIAGGLMQRYQRGGCWFDTGFHLTTDSGPGGTFRAILARLGILDQVHFLDPDRTAQFVVSAPGIAPIALPIGLAGTRAACTTRFPNQAAAIERFFDRVLGRLADNAWLAGLANGHPIHVDLPDAGVSTVDSVLAECGGHGDPAIPLGSAAGILAMRSAQCPFDLYAAFAGSSFAGGWRIVDGGDGLTGPLISRFCGLGGTLHLGRPAVSIEHDGAHATAVIDAEGASYPADLVVGAIHPDIILRLIGDHGVRPSWRQHVRATPDGAGAFLLAMKLTQPPHALANRHHFLRLDDGSDAYVVAPDCWLPGAPAGPHQLDAMVWVPVAETATWAATTLGRRGPDYLEWKKAREENLLAALEQRFPGLRATVTRTWTASPLTFRDYLGGRDGAAMGLSHDVGHLGSQPLPARSKIRNVLFTGQNFGHPGILGCLISACTVAGSVLQRDLRQEILGMCRR